MEVKYLEYEYDMRTVGRTVSEGSCKNMDSSTALEIPAIHVFFRLWIIMNSSVDF
uniref:Uncharacterized protein n=1 Tax=Cucumis melo TaxID=3656 RepID=A0A9I9DVV9_CUCME